ncbi:hypothetical protein HBH64_161140 [Parastagonospora nodorum]|nr:hypothetical protein HBH64_161140 [Parastagonospora nodorum]KAH4784112.1 hypothetical protein HBH63_117990 [Parastagonospora nodorum]KAH5057681.1 hypothetical protein HBH96_103950 [Parastagonospora nodorum]KAH5390619.1 hypothetical protein HBI33_025640 [Parastagonospora nodorum]KAH5968304.1 hypothetical protein HBI85_093380 [Parastagonospora nodorum]
MLSSQHRDLLDMMMPTFSGTEDDFGTEIQEHYLQHECLTLTPPKRTTGVGEQFGRPNEQSKCNITGQLIGQLAYQLTIGQLAGQLTAVHFPQATTFYSKSRETFSKSLF